MITTLDKIKALFKRPKPEAKGAEEKEVEPPETKVAEAPKRRRAKVAGKKRDESSSK